MTCLARAGSRVGRRRFTMAAMEACGTHRFSTLLISECLMVIGDGQGTSETGHT